ncbi:hypothetical protein H4V97_002826 [Flavobacterium sp. CG_23.5]|uniref:hypothetical protein n=1 Tax=unclassified Flavobacterium TaxID=196869 RepID=UPI0018CA214F|nr:MULTISPECIES: hypothetical protein [unclassified Flavobacterium]MBG6112190.1 hypothetical protein [Flavobacterium sp. CG_9.10]MBP2284508.1 hypothetical protein [Flavobacterium sp. CG_23.5]
MKTFWIKYIAIGILTLIFISCDSGSRIDYNLKTNFIYKNLTPDSVEIILYDKNGASFKNYIIEPSKEISFSLTQEGDKTGLGQPFAFENDTRFIAKKVVIKFITSNKCLSFSEGEGVLDIKKYDNFSESMYSTSNNTLIYNIDSVELNNATNCL